MADVLSQAQIDALLNQVRNESKDLEKPAEEKQKKYQKYDFSSPRKFTKDRIKMLNGIFENYTRAINSRLNALLRINCEMEVEVDDREVIDVTGNGCMKGYIFAQTAVSEMPE